MITWCRTAAGRKNTAQMPILLHYLFILSIYCCYLIANAAPITWPLDAIPASTADSILLKRHMGANLPPEIQWT